MIITILWSPFFALMYISLLISSLIFWHVLDKRSIIYKFTRTPSNGCMISWHFFRNTSILLFADSMSSARVISSKYCMSTLASDSTWYELYLNGTEKNVSHLSRWSFEQTLQPRLSIYEGHWLSKNKSLYSYYCISHSKTNRAQVALYSL